MNLVGLFAIVSILAVASLVAVHSFWVEFSCYRPFRKSATDQSIHMKWPGLVNASWVVGQSAIRGWFLPGESRATVILMHGTRGTRADLLSEFEILHAAGFAVLAFDWPGHGESAGQSDWGSVNQQALSSGLDWLAARPEVDMTRVGALAFSMGGLPLLAQAAVDPRLKATAISGLFGDVRELLGWEYRARGVLGKWPAILAAWLRGTPIADRVPRELIGHLSPRPVLVILGESDQVVPARMSQELFDGAKEPKELLALSNVGHGEYSQAATAYSEPLVAFFERSLIGEAQVGGSR